MLGNKSYRKSLSEALNNISLVSFVLFASIYEMYPCLSTDVNKNTYDNIYKII